jgi:dienelactone hydrolase
VLTPYNVEPPYRSVIALHGHGSGGAAHLLGRVRSEATRAAETAHIEAHNYTYAHQLATHGFMVFAPEQRGFGERMETHPGMTFGGEMSRSSCRSLAFNALMMGKTLLGMRVWDVMRTLDYIATRPEAMTAGVGCVGLSGGGTTTLYATIADPRITVAILSGAFSSFRSSIMSTIHCDCNYIPAILQYAEMADLAALIAPRPLLIEAGTEDPIFPVDVVKSASQEVARVYDLLDVPDHFDQDIFAGGHRFSGNKTFDWFAKWL